MGKKKKWLTALLTGCMAAALLTGCGGGGNQSAGDKTTLKVGVTNFADSLEPTENAFGWVVVRYGMGETLTQFDEKMNIQPWLAESWEISDDKLTWIFKIRDVKFSNGRPLTAAAVKASLERTFAKNTRAATFFKYTNMEADGQTLKITTEKPAPSMLGYLADPLFLIVDVESEKERNFATQGPICTGPYICESFVKEKAVMKKNPNYWGGEVPFETIEIPSIDDPNTRAMALQSGEVDMAVNIAAGDIGLFSDTAKFHVDRIASLRTVLARINQKGILGDPKVRAAFISMTDRKAYNEVILKGTFIPGKAPVPPSLDYGFDQLTDPNAYNVERAKQPPDEAGGKVTAKKVGIDVKVKTVDYNLLDKIGINGEYDLLISNITTANTGDPEIYLNWYWRTNINGNNPQNGSGYSNPAYDALCADLAVEFDRGKRRQLMIDMQQILLDDGAALFLGYPETNIISSTKITGAIMHPADYYWITNKIKPAK